MNLNTGKGPRGTLPLPSNKLVPSQGGRWASTAVIAQRAEIGDE